MTRDANSTVNFLLNGAPANFNSAPNSYCKPQYPIHLDSVCKNREFLLGKRPILLHTVPVVFKRFFKTNNFWTGRANQWSPCSF